MSYITSSLVLFYIVFISKRKVKDRHTLLSFICFCPTSDLTEKSVALMQAMIDFNCFVPKDIDNLPGSSQKPFFEAYWDSDVPRY